MLEFVKKGQINIVDNFNISDDFIRRKTIFYKERYPDVTAKEYLISKCKCDELRALESLKLVNLCNDILDIKVSKLSLGEKIKIELARHLITNDKELILFQFDKFFMEKDLLYFKKLFKKLSTKYNKTIVLIDVSFKFFLDFADRLVLNTSNDLVKVYKKDDFFNEEITKYLDIPPIIDFIRYVNNRGKKIDNYTNFNDLLKAIYREA